MGRKSEQAPSEARERIGISYAWAYVQLEQVQRHAGIGYIRLLQPIIEFSGPFSAIRSLGP